MLNSYYFHKEICQNTAISFFILEPFCENSEDPKISLGSCPEKTVQSN